MRNLVSVLVAITLLMAACGDDDTVEASDVSIVDDTTASDDPDVEDDDIEEEGEGRDPEALFGTDVCEALIPALDGDRAGLEKYATTDVLDQLEWFGGPAESAEVAEAPEGCEIAIGDAWATLSLEGDGHVGQQAVAVVFDSSGGDGFDPFLEDVPAAVDAYLDDPAACDGDAEPSGDLPNHEIYGLSGGYVVGVICFRAAYQNVYELFGWDGVDLINLTVEQWQEGAVVESPFVAGLPSEDTAGGTLTNVEKARGVGDCGVRSQWSLTDTTLSLDTAWARECDDAGDPVGPEDWPIVYTRG